MSGNYPPPGGGPNPYGQSGLPSHGRPAHGYGYGHAGHGQQYGRPDFVPPEQMYHAQQPWGGGYYYGDPMHGQPGWMEPPDPAIQTNAIFAMVASIVTLMCCSNIFAIGGVVCSIVALTRWQQQPESARNLNRWAWISTAGGLVIVVLFFIAYITFVIWLGSSGGLA